MNPYRVLGISKDADEATIKRAYKTLVKEHHPDRGGDSARFQEIQNAYDILRDPEKKAEFDNVDPFDTVNFPMRGDAFTTSFNFSTGFPEDGANIRDTVVISWPLVFNGGTAQLQGVKYSSCPACEGAGLVAPLTPICRHCDSTGYSNVGIGMRALCAACFGTGKSQPSECRQCRGAGFLQRPHTYTVKIPAGIKDGSSLRLPGRGRPGINGGKPGDLLVKVRYPHDPNWRFYKGRLEGSHNVDPVIAVLGGEAEIVRPDSTKVQFKIPAGTTNGKVIRLPGKGPGDNDLYLRVNYRWPKSLSRNQKLLLNQYKSSLDKSS